MKKILVTGATGFLGNHVQKKLAKYEEGYYIRYEGSYFDLCTEHRTNSLFEEFRPDTVIHLAAVCGGSVANKNAPGDMIVKNLKMAINVFEAARHYKVDKIYTIGTIESYPKYCKTPFHESYLWNGYPEDSSAPFGVAKKAILTMSKSYREQYNIGGINLILPSLYGEHDHFYYSNSNLMPYLINKIYMAKLHSMDIVHIPCSKEISREFLYAGDAASAIVSAAIRNIDYVDPINIGTGKSITMKSLVDILTSLLDYNGCVLFEKDSSAQPIRKMDVRRADEILDFAAKTKLVDGLKKTIAWYKDDEAMR